MYHKGNKKKRCFIRCLRKASILLAFVLILEQVLVGKVAFAETPDDFTPAEGWEDYDYFNFAEALQKSIYFYDAQKCGPGITGGRLEWRGDCHVDDCNIPLEDTSLSASFIAKYKDILDPDRDGMMDLHGGFHDAGDHVRFGLPQSYTAGTLGWGFYEFRDAFKDTGMEEHMLEILKYFTDTFLRCSFLDEGNLIAFCYMVGEGSLDHSIGDTGIISTQYSKTS